MKYKLCQPLLCHVQLRHFDVIIVDDHHGVTLNTIDFDYKHKQLCIVSHGITISSLKLFNTYLRKHLVCHIGRNHSGLRIVWEAMHYFRYFVFV